jgi:hypothetical protein
VTDTTNDVPEPSLEQQIATVKAQIKNASTGVPSVNDWTATNALTISGGVLVFGLVVLLVAAHLIRNGKSADSILKIFGTITIIIAAVFLIVAGYSDRQISPVIGLLGTIAGYLLGKESNKREP